MGYKCCVPGCKSNYDSESKDGNQKSVSTFGFPKDEQIRQQWIRNIPRDLPNITKHTRVCMNSSSCSIFHGFEYSSISLW